MKKTIITVALSLACAVVAAADSEASPSYSLGEINYTTTAGFGSSAGNYYTTGFSFTLSDGLFTGTADTINAVTTASDASQSFTSQLGLTSIKIITRYSNLTAAPDAMSAIRITDTTTNNVVATSTSVTVGNNVKQYDVFDSSIYFTKNTLTYNFSALDSVLSKGTTYKVEFLSSTGALTTTNEVGILAGNAGTTGSFSTLANSASYQPGGMVISTTSLNVVEPPTASVPEPATATLSLLALAGLAARRRRH